MDYFKPGNFTWRSLYLLYKRTVNSNIILVILLGLLYLCRIRIRSIWTKIHSSVFLYNILYTFEFFYSNKNSVYIWNALKISYHFVVYALPGWIDETSVVLFLTLKKKPCPAQWKRRGWPARPIGPTEQRERGHLASDQVWRPWCHISKYKR